MPFRVRAARQAVPDTTTPRCRALAWCCRAAHKGMWGQGSTSYCRGVLPFRRARKTSRNMCELIVGGELARVSDAGSASDRLVAIVVTAVRRPRRTAAGRLAASHSPSSAYLSEPALNDRGERQPPLSSQTVGGTAVIGVVAAVLLRRRLKDMLRGFNSARSIQESDVKVRGRLGLSSLGLL